MFCNAAEGFFFSLSKEMQRYVQNTALKFH